MKNGILTFNGDFNNTAMQTIVCRNNITFGHKVLTSWNTLIMDTDFHQIIELESRKVSTVSKPIIVGDNVWICTRAVILKGSEIPSGCIVGANSLVSKKFDEINCIIAGNPASIKKKGITRYIE